jgi:hypothetical protein
MFVIFDKKTGYVRVTCTENPLNSIRLVSNWHKHYDVMEFPYMNFIRASDTVLRVDQKQLKVLGGMENLPDINYAKLFEGE